MNRLPKVLQHEIWEYVHGDRAFWKLCHRACLVELANIDGWSGPKVDKHSHRDNNLRSIGPHRVSVQLVGSKWYLNVWYYSDEIKLKYNEAFTTVGDARRGYHRQIVKYAMDAAKDPTYRL
jgi:hypothetical protein